MKKLVNIDMSWDEIKRRAKNGASLSVLADLNGVNTAVMREIIKGLEEQTGEKLQFAPKEKAIKKTMKKQKIDHQKVVEMYEAGKTVKEIAAEMGCNAGSVRTLLSRVRRRAKSLLTGGTQAGKGG
jgi:DNA-directed RNA polymerase specialized sigma24 family protein